MTATPRFVELAEVDSTNAEALRRAVAGERGPLYIRADRQTSGRGRSGRSWETAAGNLALSRLGTLACEPVAVPQLSLVAGVAVHGAVSDLLEGNARAAGLSLKWPNDLLLEGAKVAGILVEATTIGSARVAVIGIGVNLAHAPEIANRATAALADATRRSISPAATARHVAGRLEHALQLWDGGAGFATIRAAWLAAATPPGTRLAINTGRGTAAGVFAGLAPDGALLLDVDGGERQTFSVGDVALIAG